MKARYIFAALFSIFLIASCSGQGQGRGLASAPGPKITILRKLPDGTMADQAETAVLAGGCFWGVEGVYEQLEGVLDVRSGYAGGSAATADYRTVSMGTTGHAESVEIVYDPGKITYETLLEVFFTVAHNPTELNKQGPDHGTQYRSAVFFTDSSQERIVRQVVADFEARGVYSEPIVTEISPLEEFYPAEEYHQDFMRLNPDYPYIVYWDLPKLRELEREFPELIAAAN